MGKPATPFKFWRDKDGTEHIQFEGIMKPFKPIEHPKKKQVCGMCGSDRVRRKIVQKRDYEKQRWDEIREEDHCYMCDGETYIQEVEG